MHVTIQVEKWKVADNYFWHQNSGWGGRYGVCVYYIRGGVYPGLKAVSSDTAFSYMVVVDL